jgi:(p)ppGpp synthase/HD superfamily hydrolase
MIEQAKQMASWAHEGQLYGYHPYTVHLNDVVNVLKRFGHNKDVLVAAAYLHDTLEDTPLPFESLFLFGEDVVNIVYAVTNEIADTRQERLLKTYPKIRANKNAIIVKLADRIANVEACLRDAPDMYQQYLSEYGLFRIHLFQADPDTDAMWSYLDKLCS